MGHFNGHFKGHFKGFATLIVVDAPALHPTITLTLTLTLTLTRVIALTLTLTQTLALTLTLIRLCYFGRERPYLLRHIYVPLSGQGPSWR